MHARTRSSAAASSRSLTLARPRPAPPNPTRPQPCVRAGPHTRGAAERCTRCTLQCNATQLVKRAQRAFPGCDLWGAPRRHARRTVGTHGRTPRPTPPWRPKRGPKRDPAPPRPGHGSEPHECVEHEERDGDPVPDPGTPRHATVRALCLAVPPAAPSTREQVCRGAGAALLRPTPPLGSAGAWARRVGGEARSGAPGYSGSAPLSGAQLRQGSARAPWCGPRPTTTTTGNAKARPRKHGPGLGDPRAGRG